MITNNLKFNNFKIKKNKTLKIKLVKILQDKNFFINYKLLKTLKKNYLYSYNLNKIKEFEKINNFNIIGMGGSILGTQAIYSFLKFKIKKKFFFFNNLNSKINTKSNLKKANIIVSKSGNTLETILNSSFFLKSSKNVIITEKKNSYLTRLAKKLKTEIIEHKNYIGGRYSVLSEVGMLPSELMGLDTKRFKKFNELIKNKKFINNLIDNTICIYKLIQKGVTNSVLLNYDESSHEFLKWYQQLTSESLGKKNKGIFPIISSMPRDNHSLLQLYLDGPKNNFYTFFSVKEKNSTKLKKEYLIDEMKKNKNKKVYDFINYQKVATENVFREKRLPFRSFEIVNRNEDSLGELFTFFILETILLANLLKINPLDQPSVELVKKETRRLLKI